MNCEMLGESSSLWRFRACLQVNKSTAVDQLRSWRSTSKKLPLNLYLGRRHVIRMRNVVYGVIICLTAYQVQSRCLAVTMISLRS